MKSLVIAEKPSVARDIARVLHCSKNIPGALEGDKYIVTWALGHLVTLADPEEYDKKLQQMGHGNTADDAKENAACRYQTDGKTVWAGEKINCSARM